ncbi:BTB/POZ domain-containing protein 6-like isoform X1 [Paramacrobiotus metropolitanus]|uniref:BTB/POZ domain-containing protein 6-like isoform X1 n=1 Tax=Paramacrobiotus metropolitanus TaxID=2943436 RepID=UPI00244575A0|nr:BTB/POZ domain-containing protein 6-like isoform X1 [Paramacrobiotus metropolitanus]
MFKHTSTGMAIPNPNLSTSHQRPRAHRASGLYSYAMKTLTSGDLSDMQFSVGGDFGAAKKFKAHKYPRQSPPRGRHFSQYSFSAGTFLAFAVQCSTRCSTEAWSKRVPRSTFPTACPTRLPTCSRYMYSDAVENLTAGNVVPTMRCADKYDLPELASMCLEFVDTKFVEMNIGECVVMLEQAVQWHVEDVVEKCLQLVKRQSDTVLQTEQFTTISQETLKMILQSSALTSEENIVYSAVERWAMAACKRDNLEPTAVNRRSKLGDALFLVRFPLLTGAQLVAGPGKSGLLLDSELLSIFMHQNGAVETKLAFSTERRSSAAGQAFVQDEVFAQDGGWWQPAKVVGTLQDEVVLTWCASSNEARVAAAKVVRAADILKSGQLLCCKVRQPSRVGTYVQRNAEHHHVRFSDGEDAYPCFSQLFFKADQVSAWKAGRASGL